MFLTHLSCHTVPPPNSLAKRFLCAGMPRGAGWNPIEMELPKQIVVSAQLLDTLTLDDLDENIRLVVSVHHERLSLSPWKRYRCVR